MAMQNGVFTFTSITESTGEAAHDQLEEIEVIFGAFERIDSGALRQCRNLRKFTMVNCNLLQISSLEPVSASLVHLCLSDQKITTMTGLSTLHQLRHLYLQQNRISQIEGLERCRELRTLWLYDNCLSTVDNLTYCTNLRELWLQDNQIQTLKASDGGIAQLVNLKRLNVANNQIHDMEDLKHLQKLIALRHLTFTDEHFGSNPIVKHPNYRSFAITALKQLHELDGIVIVNFERTTAEDLFLTQSMEFNDQLAELALAYQQELRSISTRRERGIANTQRLQQELMEALNDVEACVMAGQSKIEEEKRRQLQLREQNTQLLQENVTKLQEVYYAAIKDQCENEERALLQEEQQYEIMELEAMAEQNLALTIAELQNAFPSKIAFQHLPEHVADYRFIAEDFRRSSNQQEAASCGAGDQDGREVRILQMYRFFHEDLTEAFRPTVRRVKTKRAAQGNELYLYMIVNGDELTPILQNGLTPTNSAAQDESTDTSDDGWIFLFSNPLVALQFYKGTISELEPLSDDNEIDSDLESTTSFASQKSSPLVESFYLMLCQVRMQQIVELFCRENVQLSSLEALCRVASPQGSVLPPSSTAFLQLKLDGCNSWSTSSSGGHVYMAKRTNVWSQVLPQVVLLCSKRGDVSDGGQSGSKEHDNQSPSGDLLLSQFQQQLRVEVNAYHSRLYHEMDPATVGVRKQLQHENEQLHERLRDNESQIDREIQKQDRIVRALRGGNGERSERARRR